MIKLSDYVVAKLADWGVRHVFLIPGGGAMHLNDSFSREPRIGYLCNHHEQASAMAAECYARVTGTTGVVNVTTGPGGINALNGVFGAWTDSVPMLVISGQVKRETCMATMGLRHIRQLGDQEVDIVRMASGITKYAVLVDDPESIRYHLERAWFLAGAGRPGPCWLDIPVDVQSARIEEQNLRGYDPAEDADVWNRGTVERQCREVIARLAVAERPVLMAGTGVRAAHALEEFREVVRRLAIPVTTAWTHDLIATDDPLFCGRPGTIGERAGNFTVQNADALLVLGSRLNIRQVSYNWPSFAPHAFVMQVDVDAAELEKPTVRPDLPIHCDLKVFLEEMLRQAPESWYGAKRHGSWLAWCRERVTRYPVVQEKHRTEGSPVNPYHFIEQLFAKLADDEVVVCGNAAACIVSYQVARLKAGQRLISNSGAASMGYDLPAAVGAAIGREGKRVICLAGDGSIQLNIQELQTIAHHQLPVKIFVLDNGGYLSVRQTQSNFFGKLVGESPASGVSFPDIARVAAAYGLPAMRIESSREFDSIEAALEAPGPALCHVRLDPAQEFEPRLKSRQLPDGKMVSPTLEEMYPFLPPEELELNLVAGRTRRYEARARAGGMRGMRNAIFDLDGTLIDSLPGIRWSVDTALRSCGLPLASRDLQALIGPPVRDILAAVSGVADADVLDRLEQSFRASYDSEGWRRTVCQAGVPDMLWQLLTSGVELWVVTNKPALVTGKILQELKIGGFFREVACRDSQTPPFASKAETLIDLVTRRMLDRAECLMIGDTAEDWHAAEAAGIGCAIVPNGYGAGSLPPGCRRIEGWSELEATVEMPQEVNV